VWEYTFILVREGEDFYSALLEQMNEAGKDGWEFTGQCFEQFGDNALYSRYLMKRRVPSGMWVN